MWQIYTSTIGPRNPSHRTCYKLTAYKEKSQGLIVPKLQIRKYFQFFRVTFTDVANLLGRIFIKADHIWDTICQPSEFDKISMT